MDAQRPHLDRALKLLSGATGVSWFKADPALRIMAYQAVLTEDLLVATQELLSYKQNEVHR
jgi:hypothetical protein